MELISKNVFYRNLAIKNNFFLLNELKLDYKLVENFAWHFVDTLLSVTYYYMNGFEFVIVIIIIILFRYCNFVSN